MFETYRMLGEEREAELLREAQRLHAGQAVRDARVLRTARRRLVSVLFVTAQTVEAHVRQIFLKLRLDPNAAHRRVLAVLAHLRGR